MKLKQRLNGENRAALFAQCCGIDKEGTSLSTRIKVLSPSEITLLPEVFQQRQTCEETLAAETHIQNMSKALKRGHKLDPITVFPLGSEYVCIDGHHRLVAYKNAAFIKRIPVCVFEGSFREAWSFSLTANNKDKLPMTTADKMEATWIMLLTGEYSWSEIVARSGAGRGTVQRMTNAREQLRTRGETPEGMTWEEARIRLKGDMLPITDEQLDAMCRDMAKKLVRTFGPDLAKRAHLIAKGLILCSEQAAKAVYETLNEELETEDGDDSDF